MATPVQTQQRQGSIWSTALVALALIPVVVPLYYFALVSIRSKASYLNEQPWFPTQITFAAYSSVWDHGFFLYLRNSLIVTVTSSVVTVIFALLAAYAIYRSRSRMTDMAFRYILFGIAIPIQAAVIPLYFVITTLSLQDNLLGVIWPTIAGLLPVNVLLYANFLRGVPPELFDAMEADGASEWQMLWRLAFPLSRVALAPLLIYNAMRSWDDLLLPLVVLHSNDNLTLTPGLVRLQAQYAINVPVIMAGVVLSVLPLLLLFLVLRRQMIAGLTAGALK